ncbi:L,D-transpeptidase [Rhizobium glycinendophyticum]|uniref:L,D-transpeptidase n=1 Tax=Rhizobium glycinendophyticum TaxID=2589807 RepID=A0A504U4Y4_9HYPH|nr:L,D-transpeptidase [Rhizobium glycinendophyticum]TPP10038.1 L,D-transpeptidase [Rhizobium glycinendophyticum]
MLKKSILALIASLSFAFSATANDRYQSRPPVMVSPDLQAAWLLQLGGLPPQRRGYATRPVANAGRQMVPVYRQQTLQTQPVQQRPVLQQRRVLFGQQPPLQQVAMRPNKPVRTQIEPQFLPQMVEYQTTEKPGTIVIDTRQRFLYLVMENGMAKRYGVGVGKPGFEWAGTHKVTAKREWPSWNPPQEMIAREAAKGHYLPASMEGGPENPLGARAMYLGSTLYRIHGTNAPWSIGSGVSSGCIRMRNEDVTDLYDRVKVGTKVIVI